MTDEHKLTIAELLEKMETGLHTLEEAIGGLTEAQIAAPSTALDWSIKDHVMHLEVWARGIVALMRREPRWQAMGLEPGFVESANVDEINTAIHQQHKDKSWAEVKAAFYATHQAVYEALKALTDADLQKPYAHFQPQMADDSDTQPVVGWIIGNTYEHYEEHLPWMQARMARDRQAGD
jgi:hypothetical protein